MEKDKSLMKSEGLKSLKQISVQLGLVDKVLHEAELSSVPTMTWWDSLSDEWKRHLLFHISRFYVAYCQSSYGANYDEWYLGTYGKRFSPKIKISESALKKVLNLTSLFLPKCSLTDLSPIKHLKNLENLDLRLNNIKNISPLAELRQLRTLSLYANWELSDIEPISTLKELITLNLCEIQISNLNSLKNLCKLQNLDLSNSGFFEDLSPLENLTEIENLQFNHNRITNIRYISKLTKLKTLSLSVNQINDFSYLSNLPNLETLYLCDTEIQDKDLKFLSKIKTLKYVDLMTNPVSNDAVDKFKKIRPDISINFDRDGNRYYNNDSWI